LRHASFRESQVTGAPLEPAERARLDLVYRATRYRVDAPAGAIVIRVGERNDAIDELLRTLATDRWAYVSAANPGSRPMPRSENDRRHAYLIVELERAGRHYIEGMGEGDDPAWPAERSVWVSAISRVGVARLGRRFEQNAVLHGSLGAQAELLWLR
jgi:hypothetical protein